MEQLEGTLERIVYEAEDHGYMVARFIPAESATLGNILKVLTSGWQLWLLAFRLSAFGGFLRRANHDSAGWLNSLVVG